MCTRIELALAAVLYAGALQAAHPLITEDAATLGAGGAQLELNGERRAGPDGERGALLGLGITETLDLIVGKTEGVADVSLDLKWRFHRSGNASFAFKPGLTTAGSSYGAFLVASFENDPWTTHLHAGYKANRKVPDEPADVVHLSAAALYQASERLKLAADLGLDTDFRLSSSTQPAWLVVGAIYSVGKRFDFDIGWRRGLNRATDDALLAGMTARW